MPDFEAFNLANAHLAAFLLVPGIVALFTRSRFLPGHLLPQHRAVGSIRVQGAHSIRHAIVP